MADTLSTAEVRFQAEKLTDFVRRGGDAARWWASKDFTPKERTKIQKAARLLRLRGSHE
jgi:hypothetical protein